MLKITKIKPVATRMLVTGETYSEDMYNDGGIIENKKGDMKEYQTVLEVGPMVRDIKVGDTVMINVANYAVRKYDPNSIKEDMDMNKTLKYAFNWVTLDGEGDCLLLNDRDIMFVFEGEEVQGYRNPLILPKGKKIIGSRLFRSRAEDCFQEKGLGYYVLGLFKLKEDLYFETYKIRGLSNKTSR
jgi:co-chaperonin GroES (HSP10)